jgi:hypothetical protein
MVILTLLLGITIPARALTFEVVGAKVFSDYLVDGDWLIGVELKNRYTNYDNVTDPSQYFHVQMLNDAGTIIGATTLKSWGYSVASIYLNPTIVSSLTYGDNFTIRMIGTFTGTPSTTYVLQNSVDNNDWLGDDKRYLDQWCVNTAEAMNAYDGNTATNPYTTEETGFGEILTVFGGAKFVVAIPEIMSVRPDLFQRTSRTPDYETGTATNAYDSATTWQAQVGTQVAADAAVFGNLLGISAKSFLSMGIWMFYVFAMLYVFFNKQGAETPVVLVLCIPVLLVGREFRIIESQVFNIMAVLALLLFVVKMWFTK